MNHRVVSSDYFSLCPWHFLSLQVRDVHLDSYKYYYRNYQANQQRQKVKHSLEHISGMGEGGDTPYIFPALFVCVQRKYTNFLKS